MKKIGLTTVLTVIGTAMSLAGSLISTVASEKKTKETIAQMVADELKK